MMINKNKKRNEKIIVDYNEGIQTKDLSKKYNLSRQQIHNILHLMGGRSYGRSKIINWNDVL